MLLKELLPPTTLDLAEDERWLSTQRIVDSPHFRKSPRLSRLLLYLSEQTLLDRSELLTEFNIAILVFEREADFDPGVDTIVRSHMVRLRQKLDQYAAENRMTSSMRVTVPKGEYLVRFDPIFQSPPESQAVTVTEAAEPSLVVEQRQYLASKQPKGLVLICWMLATAVLVLFAVLL